MRPAIVIATIFVAFQILNCRGATPNPRLSFFDIDLLRYASAGKTGNVMISPASIKSTLSMILEGAKGATAEEIKSALRVSPAADDFREELIVFFNALEMKTPNISLASANALFVSKQLKLKKEYSMVVERLYHAELDQMDFNNTRTSANTINGWVNNKTQGLIPTVIEEAQIPRTAEMLVANALYFKGQWKTGFDKESTHSDCFYNNGVCKNVAMMDLQAKLNYAFVDELRAHAFELPYQGDRYSMMVLMPQDRDGIDALLRDLPYYSLPQILKLMYNTDFVLTMPKFTVNYNDNMVEALTNMRITSLFSKSANLSGIFESGVSPYINSIYHSVHMTVDESGTEAAASTLGFVVPLINDKVMLRVDRPFLFFIRDVKLDVVLFEGKIQEPTESDQTPKVQPQGAAKNQTVPIQTFSDKARQNVPRNQTNSSTAQPSYNPTYTGQSNFNQQSQLATKTAPNYTTHKYNQNQPHDNSQVYTSQHNLNHESSYNNGQYPSSSQSGSYQPIQSSNAHTSWSEPNHSKRKENSGFLGFFKSIGEYF